MEEKRDLSILNCIGTSFLAIFLSVPVHELFHLLTHIVYGSQLVCFSAGAVEGYPNFEGMSIFDKIMVSGGSASILNVIVGFILLFIVLKVNMGALMRVFMTQLTGAHLCMGIGYFLIGGFFGVGDWGNVFSQISDAPGVVTALRIVLSVLGSIGIVWLFFMLNYLSYYFIEDSTNKKERLYVAFRLHLLMLLIGYPVGILVTLVSPAMNSGELNLGLGFLYNMMWIPFFWGFMFTGPMRTLPPKKSRFLYNLPKKPNYILFAVSLILILVDIFVFGPGIYFSSGSNASAASNVSESPVDNGSLSHEGYKLEQVVVLSRHNIRSPLSGAGSSLGTITPYQWFEWSSAPSELSQRGGVLETEMGQFFRKWMESEELIPENWHPTDKEARIYANSKQRTIATAQYFSSGAFPTAGIEVEWHMDFDKMDPVFTPKLTFSSDDYALDAEAQIRELYGSTIEGLQDNYKLVSDVINMKESESYKNGDVKDFVVDDTVFKLEEGAEPGLSGSLKTACSVSDALVLQYYEEKDAKKAGFGKDLSMEQWKSISEIKDVYGDVLFTAPLVACNVANPLIEEIYSEMNTDGRVFTFLCGHDSNVGSVLAALGAEDYALPNAIEKKTPIGCKLVFSKWSNQNKETFWDVSLVYQSTEQLREMPLLNTNRTPVIYHLSFSTIQPNSDGLYTDDDIMKLFKDTIEEYQYLYQEYMEKAA